MIYSLAAESVPLGPSSVFTPASTPAAYRMCAAQAKALIKVKNRKLDLDQSRAAQFHLRPTTDGAPAGMWYTTTTTLVAPNCHADFK